MHDGFAIDSVDAFAHLDTETIRRLNTAMDSVGLLTSQLLLSLDYALQLLATSEQNRFGETELNPAAEIATLIESSAHFVSELPQPIRWFDSIRTLELLTQFGELLAVESERVKLRYTEAELTDASASRDVIAAEAATDAVFSDATAGRHPLVISDDSELLDNDAGRAA